MKTGHTDTAGYNIVASALRDKNRYISVVMGAPSSKIREQDSVQLLNYGFNRHVNKIIASSDSPISLNDVKINDAKSGQILKIAPKNNLYKTIPVNFAKNLSNSITLIPGLSAPIYKGQEVGNLTIKAGDNIIATTKVYAVNSIDKASLFSRIFS